MNFRKYMVLTVGCGTALALAIAAAVFLFQQMAASVRAKTDLTSTMAKLAKLNKRTPAYPSKENVEQTQTNLTALLKVLADTQIRLRAGQVEPEQIESSRFATLLERTTRQLTEQAAANSVALPKDFDFGFASYSEGVQPSSNAIPRLVTQLATVADLCRILYAAKITNIVAIGRDRFEFETSAQPGGGAPGGVSRMPSMNEHSPSSALLKEIPQVASNELYSVERFALEFDGHENSIWEVLNALVKGPPFAVIRDFSLESVTTGQAESPAGAGRTGYPSFYPVASGRFSGDMSPTTGVSTNLAMTPRDERVVAGREVVHATIVVDVCRFAITKGVSP